MNFKNGIHELSNEQYHAADAVGRSGLWALRRSPLHCFKKYLDPNREPFVETEAMLRGSIAHCLILEPLEFDKRYAVKPELLPKPAKLLLKDVGRELFNKNKADIEDILNKNKVTMAVFEKHSQGKQVIWREDHRIAKEMADNLLAHEHAKLVLKDSLPEQSIFFTHEATGLQCKTRPDAMRGTIVVDVKTARDGMYRNFQSAAYSSGYFLQAAMAKVGLKSVGVEMEEYIIVGVENKAPHATFFYPLDMESVDASIEVFDELMLKYAECKAANLWPGYESKVLELPRYANYEGDYE